MPLCLGILFLFLSRLLLVLLSPLAVGISEAFFALDPHLQSEDLLVLDNMISSHGRTLRYPFARRLPPPILQEQGWGEQRPPPRLYSG